MKIEKKVKKKERNAPQRIWVWGNSDFPIPFSFMYNYLYLYSNINKSFNFFIMKNKLLFYI
jgi:hypothetical protein